MIEEDKTLRVSVEDWFDLHSFLPRDIPSVVEEYLREARERGYREIRLVHGKGAGVRRAQVRRLLRERCDVEGFSDAPPERGGTGATIVFLRP